jgi:GrpB-like predicted nucleotidyltransferase (UPF0157 family)
MKVIIEEYNPNWKLEFLNEKKFLLEVFAGIDCKVEHIGSTSVAGLGAKPVIDILIGLNDFSCANEQVHKLIQIGYHYINRYEDVMPYRRFFIKESNDIRTHHIHMVEFNSEFWIRHLAFREYLINHPEEKIKYYELKKELSLIDWKDGNEYANAKSGFIKEMEKKAMKEYSLS